MHQRHGLRRPGGKTLGVISEILPRKRLLHRAREIAAGSPSSRRSPPAMRALR
jgi:hypothetical protein